MLYVMYSVVRKVRAGWENEIVPQNSIIYLLDIKSYIKYLKLNRQNFPVRMDIPIRQELFGQPNRIQWKNYY